MNKTDSIDLMDSRQTWHTDSEEETHAVAERCVLDWTPPLCVALIGPLGSGKTTFVNGVVNTLGDGSSTVRSPTFTLINQYSDTEPTVTHADLYRVESIHEQETVGLDDFFGDGFVLVEWADHWNGQWPDSGGYMKFEYRGLHKRTIHWAPNLPEPLPSVRKSSSPEG